MGEGLTEQINVRSLKMAKLKIGVLVSMGREIETEIKKVRDLGLESCQLATWDPESYTDENAARVRKACADYDVEISALWTGAPGRYAWNFTEGPATIGLVPPEMRQMRVEALLKGAEFAAKLKVPDTITHAGFIPENPADPLYEGTIDALRTIAARNKELGLHFCFETGQETPITLLRAINDIGTGNLGINLDPANLLMYGKANPVDALDIIGPYVRGVHAKDGEYPTDPSKLGVEKPMGEGRVNFPVFVPKLKSFGYAGALTIEREISGDQQIADIKKAIAILEPLC
ncbi:MAG: sugar phosphate isomerase/epimerase family protein [Armatimonadota bacterium]|jgi:L-ribulose-5-phosphate 3-epimerase